MKRFSLLLTIGILVAMVTGVYTGVLYWQKAGLSAEAEGLNKNVSEYKNELVKYESQSITEAINAKKLVSELSLDSIRWSKVIKEIRQTLPEDKEGEPTVEVLSYSGSSNNDILMSVKTLPTSDQPYLDVATLIQTFDNSANFENNFIPSISTGTNEEGKEILSFMLNTRFIGDDEPVVEVENSEEKTPVTRSTKPAKEEEEKLEEAVTDVLEEKLSR